MAIRVGRGCRIVDEDKNFLRTLLLARERERVRDRESRDRERG